jgi:hypothetical protein
MRFKEGKAALPSDTLVHAQIVSSTCTCVVPVVKSGDVECCAKSSRFCG